MEIKGIKIESEEEADAIGEFLEAESLELKDIKEAGRDEDGSLHLNTEVKSYRIMNNKTAQKRAEEYIKNNVWSFNTDFILSHSKLDDEAKEFLKDFQANKCESANDSILALIEDINDFIEDAINTDGRGHFLSFYNSEEYELVEDFIYIRED